MNNLVRLGEIFEFKNGRAFKKSEWCLFGMPIIRIQNLNNKNASFNYYSGDYDERIEVNDGDLLFSWSGTVGSSFGPHIWSGPKGVLNQHIFRVSLRKGIEKRYAYYALLEITSEIEKSVSGAVGIVHVTQSNLKEFKIEVPPLLEQKRIVCILDEAFVGIDAAIANTEKNLANAQELFNSYLKSVFSQRGESWTDTTIGEQLTLQRGFDITKREQISGSVPVVSSGGVKSYHNVFKVPGPGVVIGRKGSLGTVHYISEDFWPHDTTLWVKDFKGSSPKLVYYFLRSLDVKGLDSGTANPALNRNMVHPIKTSWPVAQIHATLVERLENIHSETRGLASIYQKKLTALTELKQSLLQKAFSGELTANNVVEIAPEKDPKTAPKTKTDSPEFAAQIMAAAYHWHQSQNREKTFGRVKAQKIVHLVESLADIDLGRQPIKDAAGPNDSGHMRAAESWARDHGFFEFVQRSTGQRGYDFKKGVRFGELVAEAMATLEPYKNVLNRVVKLLMPLNTTETEILATVYAAWNNLMLEGVESTDAAIIHEARENWHLEKQKYTKEQFLNAIHKLRNNGVVPMGRGNRVTGQESLSL